MKYDPDFNHRQSIRLNGYDYSTSGAYFITICTHEREYLLGDIVNKTIKLNTFGDIARTRKRTPKGGRIGNNYHSIIQILLWMNLS